MCSIHVLQMLIPRLPTIVKVKRAWYLFLLDTGGFRNLERGVQPLACEVRPQIFGLPRSFPVTLDVRTEYLKATLGLVKCLEISKELIHECKCAWLLLLHATPA